MTHSHENQNDRLGPDTKAAKSRGFDQPIDFVIVGEITFMSIGAHSPSSIEEDRPSVSDNPPSADQD